jgi:von Willebrand factor type A domain
LRVARLLAWLAVVAVVIAAAQPSIQAPPRERVGILEVVVDRSGSTLAADLAPTRLDAIRQATLALLDRVPEGVQVGLVAFSDEARTLAPPTTDRDAVRARVASLRPNGGTAIGDALRRALGDIQAARPAAPAAVLLLSDGSNSTGSDVLDAARVAAARHVPVFAVAVGTPDGFLSRPDLAGPRQPVPPDPALLAAIALLRRHQELADQRRAEADRHRLNRIQELLVSACDVCKAEPLTGTATVGARTRGGVSCSLNLNTSVLRKVAQRADVPAASLAAMLIHYEQELCLQGPVSSRSPFAAGLRLAHKLRDSRLFDLLYAQVDGRERDWRTVEQGVALLRRHGELGTQRWEELHRRRLNQVGPLLIQVCRGCLPDLLGDASTAPAATGAVGCDIRVDLAVVKSVARDWGLPVIHVVATLLAHEQEHCIRHPDDRETPAINAERRLARKLGGGGLLDYIASLYRELDRSGHWKQ